MTLSHNRLLFVSQIPHWYDWLCRQRKLGLYFSTPVLLGVEVTAKRGKTIFRTAFSYGPTAIMLRLPEARNLMLGFTVMSRVYAIAPLFNQSIPCLTSR